MNDQIFKEMMNDAITSKILNGQLNTVLEKNVTKLFQNRKLIEQLMGSGFKNVAPLATGGMGAVYNFGGYVMKETQICQNIQTQVSQELCDIANKNDDIQYETVDTVLDKKKYILPNHILELLCGIYLSHKLKPFTDGFGYCMSGLYDKTRKATYILQERLTPINQAIKPGFNGLSLSDYLLLLYEILMTLAISQDKYKFVHYDLHSLNIMFRDCGVVKKRIYDCIVTINVPNERRSIIIESRYQPVIIDYGFARFETNDAIVSPVVEFKRDGGYYLDNHLYNPYYDIVTLLRSFMVDFRRIINHAASTADMRTSATNLYNITICILSYTFRDMPHDLIDSMFLGYPQSLENPRVDINKLCKTQVRGIKDIANRILNIISQAGTNVLVGTNGFNIPAVQIPLPPVSNIGGEYTIDFALHPYRAVQNNGVNDRYYDVRNLDLFRDFKVISAPLNQRIGGINAGFAWQYENYRISRISLGLANDRKRYNLTFTPDVGQQYNDELHISCAVMWNPSTRTTPFRFSTECCRIDAKRFLQDERIKEGITINGTFFQWTKNFGPIGFFKKDQLTIDDSDINFNYASDYYYIRIDENGNLSIAPTNVLLSQQPYNIFDETENTSLFTAGPKLVGGRMSLFTPAKIYDVYPYNGTYHLKYWCLQGGQRYSQAYDDVPLFRPENIANIYAQVPPVPENVFIKNINDIRPGDFIHALNPNPRSVIATTNNGLVLFFTFLGRGDFAGANAAGGATGIDLIDLSSILVNPALIAPLQLPPGTIITEAINLDGGGSSSVNIKDAAQPNIITSGQTSASYMVGNIVAYTYK